MSIKQRGDNNLAKTEARLSDFSATFLTETLAPNITIDETKKDIINNKPNFISKRKAQCKRNKNRQLDNIRKSFKLALQKEQEETQKITSNLQLILLSFILFISHRIQQQVEKNIVLLIEKIGQQIESLNNVYKPVSQANMLADATSIVGCESTDIPLKIQTSLHCISDYTAELQDYILGIGSETVSTGNISGTQSDIAISSNRLSFNYSSLSKQLNEQLKALTDVQNRISETTTNQINSINNVTKQYDKTIDSLEKQESQRIQFDYQIA